MFMLILIYTFISCVNYVLLIQGWYSNWTYSSDSLERFHLRFIYVTKESNTANTHFGIRKCC